jgi:hypothetical protein
LDIAPADDIAKELGIRIISLDRPGIGLSDPKADCGLLAGRMMSINSPTN